MFPRGQEASSSGEVPTPQDAGADHVFTHSRYSCINSQSLNCAQLFATAGTEAHQTLLSIDLSRQEYWSGFPFPPPRELPNPGAESLSLTSPALAGRFFTTAPPRKPIG